MGPSGISLGSLLLIALVFFILFGKKRAQGILSDITRSVAKFKKELDKEYKDV